MPNIPAHVGNEAGLTWIEDALRVAFPRADNELLETEVEEGIHVGCHGKDLGRVGIVLGAAVLLVGKREEREPDQHIMSKSRPMTTMRTEPWREFWISDLGFRIWNPTRRRPEARPARTTSIPRLVKGKPVPPLREGGAGGVASSQIVASSSSASVRRLKIENCKVQISNCGCRRFFYAGSFQKSPLERKPRPANLLRRACCAPVG